MRCIVKKCEHSLRTSKTTLMFVFPKNLESKTAWLKALNLKSTNINRNLKVCYRHFEPHYLFPAVAGTKKNRICFGAIPTLHLESMFSTNENETMKSELETIEIDSNEETETKNRDAIEIDSDEDTLSCTPDMDQEINPLDFEDIKPEFLDVNAINDDDDTTVKSDKITIDQSDIVTIPSEKEKKKTVIYLPSGTDVFDTSIVMVVGNKPVVNPLDSFVSNDKTTNIINEINKQSTSVNNNSIFTPINNQSNSINNPIFIDNIPTNIIYQPDPINNTSIAIDNTLTNKQSNSINKNPIFIDNTPTNVNNQPDPINNTSIVIDNTLTNKQSNSINNDPILIDNTPTNINYQSNSFILKTNSFNNKFKDKRKYIPKKITINDCLSPKYLEDDAPLKLGEKRLQQCIKLLQETVISKLKKIKALNKQVRRQRVREEKLKEGVKSLEFHKKITTVPPEVIIPPDLMTTLKNLVTRTNIETSLTRSTVLYKIADKAPPPSKFYAPDVKQFSITLNSISSQAYNYVRESFNNTLPSISVLSNWHQQKNCLPGFSDESFAALNTATEIARLGSKEVLYCNLICNEILITKQINCETDQHYGYVNFGNDEKDTRYATHILVFMLVCINRNWKLPIGYFPIINDNATKENLIRLCVENIISSGIKIISITFDKIPINMISCQLLGETNSIKSGNCYFAMEGKSDVLTFPDPCRSLKLIKDDLIELSPIFDTHGKLIHYKYIKELIFLQTKHNLSNYNESEEQSTFFEEQKNKMDLAVEILSPLVADSIDFCRDKLNLEKFKLSEGTSCFIRMINNIYDVLSSHQTGQNIYKKPLCVQNSKAIKFLLKKFIQYISGLTTADGILLIEHKKKSGFINLIISLTNINRLYTLYIENMSIVEIPTNTFSLNPLDFFFDRIRFKINPKPTVYQFASSYRIQLLRTVITEGSFDNCLFTESIQPNVDDSVKININCIEEINLTATKSFLIDETMKDKRYKLKLCNYDKFSDLSNLYNVFDITEIVIDFLYKKLLCLDCIEALIDDVNICSSQLTNYSSSTLKICENVENKINSIDGDVIPSKIILEISKDEKKSKHFVNNNHMRTSKHYLLLIKSIIKTYLAVRSILYENIVEN